MENATNVVKTETELNINKTLNRYGAVGLNVYQIYPNTVVYPLTGFSNVTRVANAEQFLGIDTQVYDWTVVNIGRNYSRNFNIYTTTAIGTKYVDIEYINTVGDLVSSGPVGIDNCANTLILSVATAAVNINRLTWSDVADNRTGITSSVTVYAKDTSLNTVRNSISISGGCGSSIITIPNGYIGIISDVYWRSFDANPHCKMIVKDQYNNIKATRLIKFASNTDGQYTSIDAIKYPLYPGDSVFFAAITVTQAGSNTFRHVQAIVTLTKF